MSSADPPALPYAANTEYQLPVAGFQGTPAEIERQWYERCYVGRGDSMWQLTWRAVIMGSVLGGILSLTNLYIGLKSGWGFGVAITACILSYAIWTALRRISGTVWLLILLAVAAIGALAVPALLASTGQLAPLPAAATAAGGLAAVGVLYLLLRRKLTPMTILENNCMQSTASSAGYSTGGTLVSAIAAYIIVNGHSIPTLTLMAWVFFLAILGVTMAIPMKRQMINIEQLRFPSGIAAAETLKALHTTGASGMRSANALAVAGVLAVLSKLWNEGLALFSDRLARFQIAECMERLSLRAVGQTWVDRSVSFAWEPLFLAAGAITGLRVCTSMLVGGVLCWCVFVPVLQHSGIQTGAGFRATVQWTVWGGAACMVTSGLFSFGLQWRSALRAFRDLGAMFFAKRTGTRDELGAIETPVSWFIAGQVVGTVGLAYLAQTTFGISWWLTIVAVVLSFALALVACRVCGETDTTPVGAMGQITQLTFGAICPGRMNTTLMSACVTAGAADSASDLLTDLKSGYLLGANPRKQFLAQFAGIFLGTVVSVVSFKVIVTGAEVLGTAQFPAPAAQSWSAVARALGQGLAELHPVKAYSILVGALVGIILPLIERVVPRARRFIPSAAGLGLAWTFPFYQGMLFFLGALIGWAVEKKSPRTAETYTFPVASGVIAGDALTGVTLAFIGSGPAIWQQFVGG